MTGAASGDIPVQTCPEVNSTHVQPSADETLMCNLLQLKFSTSSSSGRRTAINYTFRPAVTCSAPLRRGICQKSGLLVPRAFKEDPLQACFLLLPLYFLL